MELTNKTIQYNVDLATGENIKILINNNEVFNDTVEPNKEAKITFMYQELKLQV